MTDTAHELEELEPTQPAPGVRQMAARFASTCSTCGNRIAAGAAIRYVPGMTATHEECGDPTDRQPARMGRSSSSSRRRRPMMSYRCTHEDYPCCGCGQDAGR